MSYKVIKKEFKRIEPEVHTAIKVEAAKNGMTISQFIDFLLKQHLGK